MNRSLVSILVGVLLVSLFSAWQAHAEIPRMISYQGRVTDSGGTPVADGSYDMQFRIFNAATDGDQKWESGTVSVQVTDGMFDVLLGGSPQPIIILYFDEDYWLEVTFDGVTQSPRQRMASVGYAYMASGLVPGTQMHETMLGELLHVHNQRTSGEANGIEVRTQSSGGYAVIGMAEATSGLTRGVYGRAYSSNGRGVMGYNSATTGGAYGVYGETASTSGTAVYGWATATSGVNYGGLFETESTSGSGVRGIANATTGETYGVYGRSYSTTNNARGVYGRSYATTGATYGVYGRSDSPDGYGVYGYTPAGDGIGGGFYSEQNHGVAGWSGANNGLAYGVYGYTHSPQGRAVAGFNAATTGQEAYGVYGRTQSSETSAGFFENIGTGSGTGVIGMGELQGGIFHDTDNDAWAACGRLIYKVYGNGTVSFVQNHPYDRDKVVVYAAPEGDEVATYTRGTAQLVDGIAQVDLGETFAWVTNPDIGLTAHLTPRGKGSLLFVESLSTETMVIRSTEGFPDDIVFDYIVYGLRIGFEEHSVVQEKDLEAVIPSMSEQYELYGRRPELRQYNALERFKSMHVSIGEGTVPNTEGAEQLIAKIGTARPPVQHADQQGLIESILPMTPGEDVDDNAVEHDVSLKTGADMESDEIDREGRS